MSWPTPLFEFSSLRDVGLNCCIQHICCGPCIWGSALEYARVKNADNITIVAIVGSVIDNDAGGALSLGAFIKGRRRLVEKYEIDETVGKSSCIRCCCPVCAQIQEVNSVMVREDLKYGCATLERKSPPQPLEIQRNERKDTKNNRPSLSRTTFIERAKK
tara:strand:- start:46 stop:525 length:480 start_codon:yes stop_codon:yes gene_type:complete